MSTASSVEFERRPLVVLALGGNALSPPASPVMEGGTVGADEYAIERQIIDRTSRLLDGLMDSGHRLLVVHGNGPQVGRLLRTDPMHGNLDVHVAQTQGELGYLLIAGVRAEPMVCLLTRAVVSGELGPAVKPVGPVLPQRPAGRTAIQVSGGWRATVASPKPTAIPECDAIGGLLRSHHVVAGGGGGVPVDDGGRPLDCVVDKDWVAGNLAARLGAQHLVFATDVDAVYRRYGHPDASPIKQLSVADAQALIDEGAAAAGSMAPKLASAAEYVEATGRKAVICALQAMVDAVAEPGRWGTLITP